MYPTQRFVAVVGLLLLGAGAPAAPPVDYYQTIAGQTGADLKAELRAIVSGQRGYTVNALSYDGARDALLSSVDNVGSSEVRLVYTNEHRPTSQWAISINREHLWPQSYGTSASPLKSDMHHLLLCDSSINSSRSNFFYGNVPEILANETANPVGGAANQNYRDSPEWLVSPNHRGDVARAMLYMDTRYSQLTLVNRGESIGTNQFGYLDELLEWHDADPVDAFESGRNDRVFSFQNNRNPYIDQPLWVGLVYGSTAAGAPVIANVALDPLVPNDSDNVTISADITDADGIAVASLFYRQGDAGAFTLLAMSNVVDTYSATIPGAAEGVLIQYYITASDTLTNESSHPLGGPVSPNSYTVRGDAPVLTQLATSPSTITPIDTVHIEADVVDDDGDDAGNLTVTAYWRTLGSPAFTSQAMSILSGTTWRTAAPLPTQPFETQVEYYVVAVDAGSATAAIPSGGDTAPASYFVEGVAEFLDITSSNISTVATELLITEVSDETVDAFTEFFEITNTSLVRGYKLAGIGISDCQHSESGAPTEGAQVFPDSAVIPPGGIIVVFNRDTPNQAYIDTIPRVSNRNGAAVQVFARDASVTFDGNPVGLMTLVTSDLALAAGGDNVAMFIAIDPDPRVYSIDDVIDGVGYLSPSNGNPTAWGPGLTDTNRVTGVGEGLFRVSPLDTDTTADWQGATFAQLTPGELPASFEIARPNVVLAGAAYNSGAQELTVTEGASESVQVTLDAAPDDTVAVSFVLVGGDFDDFAITEGATLNFTPANFSVPQTLTISKAVDINITNEAAAIQVSGLNIEALTFEAIEIETSRVENWMIYNQ